MRLTLAAFGLVACMATSAGADGFTFVALGDAPYGRPEEVYQPYRALIRAINARRPAFTIHVGDIKQGRMACTDELLADQSGFFNSFESALVYTPGDNEWTDCDRAITGAADPLERLDRIRATFFKAPDKSLGKTPLALRHQGAAGYPENASFHHGGVQVVTAHVVGSNNNFETRNPRAVNEYFERNAANIAWLKQGFEDARRSDARALVVAIQADMFAFDWNGWSETWMRHSGYKAFGEELVNQAGNWGRPVLLVFGDSHAFKVFRPFPRSAPMLLAVEVFGDADLHAVEIGVDTERPMPFTISIIVNPARPLAPTRP